MRKGAGGQKSKGRVGERWVPTRRFVLTESKVAVLPLPQGR